MSNKITRKSIIDEYLEYHEKYSQKYGKDKTIILLQVGSFYECYATTKRGPNIHEISNLLNTACVKKDKSVSEISEKNPYMLGFPLAAQVKFINILIEKEYTVVIIDQVTVPPEPKREVTAIYSPGTYINGMKPDNNYLVSIYIEDEQQKNGTLLTCIGMAAIDITVGKVIINETYSSINDNKLALDETIRFLNSINPAEIILYYEKDVKHIINYLELANKNVHIKN